MCVTCNKGHSTILIELFMEDRLIDSSMKKDQIPITSPQHSLVCCKIKDILCMQIYTLNAFC